MLINALLKHSNLMRSLIFKDGSGNGSDQVKMPAVYAEKKSIFPLIHPIKTKIFSSQNIKSLRSEIFFQALFCTKEG